MPECKIVYRIARSKQQIRCVMLPFGTWEAAEQAFINLATNPDLRGGKIELMKPYDEDRNEEA